MALLITSPRYSSLLAEIVATSFTILISSSKLIDDLDIKSVTILDAFSIPFLKSVGLTDPFCKTFNPSFIIA